MNIKQIFLYFLPLLIGATSCREDELVVLTEYEIIGDENHLPLFPQSQKNGDSGIEGIMPQNTSDFGTIYNLQGQPIKTNVEYGKWNGLSPGIYIWNNLNRTHKFIIR